MLLSDLAKILQAKVVGNSDLMIEGICSLEESCGRAVNSNQPDFSRQISLFTGSSPTALKDRLSSTKAAAVIIPSKFKTDSLESKVSLLLVENPLKAMVELVPLFFKAPNNSAEISDKADVDPSAKLGSQVSIGAFSSIAANVTIGDQVTIHPSVVIYEGAQIGDRTVVHSGAIVREHCIVGPDSIIQNGAVIGSDGFGYFQDQTRLRRVPQVGKVILSDQVEVGANTCVDRATLGTTEIGSMTKVDNLSQIGHNVKIGAGTIICGQSGVAGSCSIGSGVVLGGAVGVTDHTKIENGSRFAAGSGLTANKYEKGDYAGYPAIPAGQWKKQQVVLSKMTRVQRKKD